MRLSEREEVKIKGGGGAEKLKMKTKSLLLKVGLKKEKGMSLRVGRIIHLLLVIEKV